MDYLIGIIPQGTTVFISKGWGGRASDVYITEHCGLLKNLLPGDVVDIGFTIQGSVRFYCDFHHLRKGKTIQCH